MRSIYLGTAGVLLATLTSACGSQSQEEYASSISVRSALVADTDADGVRYSLQPVDCESGDDAGDAIVVDRPVEDQVIPGGLSNLQNEPLDEDSEHAFADLFKVVEPGCYNITTQPLTEDGEDSEVCAAAFKNGVEVVEGQTTEVFLINQCAGDDPGAIDVISAFNNEPEIIEGHFSDSKFVCGSPAEFCARARDVEGDPLELELVLLSDSECEITAADPVGDDSTEVIGQCWSIDCSEVGKVDLGLRVYDQLWQDDSLVRIEDWLASEGYPNESHASLDLFAYFDGASYYPDTDGDGYGDAGADPVLTCGERPEGFSGNDRDCDDTNADVHPDAEEICEDEIDNDCDGEDAECPCAPPGELDLVLLQDLSGSFNNDVATVRGLVGTLHSSVNACTDAATFGVASFIDKPFFPFGATGDYSYQFEQGLDPDLTTLQTTVDNLVVRSGSDIAEAQLTGLMHTALDPSFSWTSGSRRVIVLMTDAVNHQAGDCDLASCPEGANDGDAAMSEYEDYPAIGQVADALNSIGAEVVFAATADTMAHYETVLAALGVDGDVVELTSDSSNLVEAVLEGLDCTCEE